ncbi:MAG: peptidyl-prolyl cis-trans isomerase [Deltaproteobacteria bacterium]|nr:peptidyl-prolyl cis-trans isomerase [Deltaproteobacteria bacterium]
MKNTVKYIVTAVLSISVLTGLSVMVGHAETANKKPVPAVTGDKAKPVATIGTNIITVSDVENKINAQIPFIRKRFAQDAEKKKFIESLIDQEVLALEAAAMGIDKKKEVIDSLKRVMIHRQRQIILESRVKITDITDEEVKNYYDKHITEFKRPERRRAAVIYFKDEAAAKPVIDELKKNKNDLRSFQALVKKHSIDADSKKRGGLLPLFDQESKAVDAELVKATFAIAKTGDLSSLVKTAKGQALIRLSGISPKLEKDVKEVSDLIKKRILKEKQQKAYAEYLAELKKSSTVKVYKEKFDMVKIDTSRKSPLGKDFHKPGKRNFRVPGKQGQGRGRKHIMGMPHGKKHGNHNH